MRPLQERTVSSPCASSATDRRVPIACKKRRTSLARPTTVAAVVEQSGIRRRLSEPSRIKCKSDHPPGHEMTWTGYSKLRAMCEGSAWPASSPAPRRHSRSPACGGGAPRRPPPPTPQRRRSRNRLAVTSKPHRYVPQPRASGRDRLCCERKWRSHSGRRHRGRTHRSHARRPHPRSGVARGASPAETSPTGSRAGPSLAAAVGPTTPMTLGNRSRGSGPASARTSRGVEASGCAGGEGGRVPPL